MSRIHERDGFAGTGSGSGAIARCRGAIRIRRRPHNHKPGKIDRGNNAPAKNTEKYSWIPWEDCHQRPLPRDPEFS